MSPVCVPCETVMKCSKTGRGVLHHDERGEPYQLWSSDEYECPSCGRRVIARFASAPISHHHEDHFARDVEAYESRGNLVHAHYRHVK